MNATAAALLGFLHDGPLSGWDLTKIAQRQIGAFWTITQSQVYRELTAMDSAGLVSKGDTGARERTPFTITAAGREAFAEWLQQSPPAASTRMPLLLTMNFGDRLPPAHLQAMITQARTTHERRLTQYQEQATQQLPPHRRATLEFSIAQERAVLAWFDRLPELLPQSA